MGIVGEFYVQFLRECSVSVQQPQLRFHLTNQRRQRFLSRKYTNASFSIENCTVFLVQKKVNQTTIFSAVLDGMIENR